MTLPSRFLIIMVVVGVVTARYSRASERCKTFHKHRNSAPYRCYSDCVTGAGEDRKVFGTGVYHESSDICLAALHIGAINSTGGFVTFEHETNVPERVYGTTRNRIVSRSMNVNSSSAVYKIIKTSPAVTQEDLRGDVVMVHNSYSDSKYSGRRLSLTCLSQDMTTKLTKGSLVSWRYETSKQIDGVITSENEHQMILTADGGNRHVFRCLGRSPATDVVAAVQFYDAKYHSPSPTVRFSKGEDVIIPLVKKEQSLSSNVGTQRLPDAWSDTTRQIPLSYGPADLSLAGIYVAGDDYAACFDVIIRECEKEKYGIECQYDCPKCQHGGQCHTQTGTCVCPPGFIGDTCQHACLPGTFGEKCQLRCDFATLGFATTREGDCHGLVICLPEPYGCSCAPGYTYLETYDGNTNPICTRECPPGTFGVNCSETCSKCRSNICDRFTGTCSCQNSNCGGAPVLSEVSASGLRRQLNINWKSVEGELYFVTYQFVKYQSCGRTYNAVMKPWPQVLQGSSPAEIKDLMPYSEYSVCVVASNSDGHSPQHCLVASTLAEVPDVNVMGLKCSSYYYNKMKCDFQISGNCENYNGPDLTYIVTIQTNLTCNKSVHELSQSGLVFADGRVTVNFPDAIAGQNYKVTAQVKNDAGNGNVTSIDFTTESTKPPPVQNLTASVIDSKTVQLLWNDPCPSNGLLRDFYITHDGEYYSLVKCPTSAVYDHCHTITGLVSGQEYEFGVPDVRHLQELKEAFERSSVLRFTYEMEKDGKLPFLDVTVMEKSGGFHTAVYTKETNIGMCLNANSDCPDRYKRSVVNAYVDRALSHSSEWKQVDEELCRVRQVLVNNGFSNGFVEDIIRRKVKRHATSEETTNTTPIPPIRLFYRNFFSTVHKTEERVLKDIVNRNVIPTDKNQRIQLTIYYKTRKTASILMRNSPDTKQNALKETNVVYAFKCPLGDCKLQKTQYIGKTTTSLSRRLTMHKQQGSIKEHIISSHNQTIAREILVNNTEIIDRYSNSRRLDVCEALHIKKSTPAINSQLMHNYILPTSRLRSNIEASRNMDQ
ncbi:uncharacterized protein [Procambarus clarkii]|uniref:uncharacterized protein isoform X2 n=1 Tax=Procambarus clarkii TaxID=6728 RepID=UPI0037437517